MNIDTTATNDASPEQEDRALFKTYGGPIEVEMVPRLDRPNKRLFMAKAFFERSTEIIVVISGRRAFETDALIQRLQVLQSLEHKAAVARNAPLPAADSIRLPVTIKGAWQCHVQSDRSGEDIKVFQLVAARWAFKSGEGELLQFGEAPAFDVSTRRRNRSYILQAREIDAVPRSSRFGMSGP